MQDRSLLLLAGLFVAVYLLPLGAMPLTKPDEYRYAEIPREMLASGDWVVPRLNGVRYFEKPVLGYWLTAISIGIFGENAFAVRFPAALSAGLTALLVYALVRRFRGPFHAAVSAGVLLTGGLFFALGNFAVLDMPLTLALTAALVSFYVAYQAETARARVAYLALFGAACGTAFLIKGFLAFAVPALAIGAFLLWERRTGGLLRWSWAAVAALLLVVLPWAALVHQREPDFWRWFFWEEHIRRFFSSQAQHAKPFWFLAPVLAAAPMLWSALLPAAAVGLRREDRKDPFLRFLLCWLILPFLFFSASRGKLATYVLPCIPPLSILIALGVTGYLDSNRRKLFTAPALVLAGLVALAGLGYALQLGVPADVGYAEGETWKRLLGLGAALICAALLWRAARAALPARRLALFCAAPTAIMSAAHFLLPDVVAEARSPGLLFARYAERVQPDWPLVARMDSVTAVNWHYRHPRAYMLDSTGEIEYGMRYPDSQHLIITSEDLARLIAECPGDALVTAALDRKYYEEWGGRLPQAEFQDQNRGFVFLQFRGGAR